MTKRRPTEAERELWRLAMRDVQPLIPQPPVAQPQPEPPSPPAERKTARPSPPSSTAARSELVPGRIVDIDKRTAERFRRGQLPIDATLDLHGSTQDEAHRQLDRFLALAATQGRRCVLVITGKGAWREAGGVLRDMVPRWLNEAPNRDRLIAVTSAQPRHGGGGAFYVLLKRNRAPAR